MKLSSENQTSSTFLVSKQVLEKADSSWDAAFGEVGMTQEGMSQEGSSKRAVATFGRKTGHG